MPSDHPDQSIGELLAKLHAPLVKCVDIPQDAKSEYLVLIARSRCKLFHIRLLQLRWQPAEGNFCNIVRIKDVTHQSREIGIACLQVFRGDLRRVTRPPQPLPQVQAIGLPRPMIVLLCSPQTVERLVIGPLDRIRFALDQHLQHLDQILAHAHRQRCRRRGIRLLPSSLTLG